MDEAQLAGVWSRIESWLSAHAPDLLAQLRQGADPSALNRLQAQTRLKLPADVKASWLRHDGASATTLPDGFRLLSLAEMTALRASRLRGTMPARSGAAAGPVRASDWNSKWLPFAQRRTDDLLCIDLDPGLGGAVGQVIHVESDRQCRVVASSFRSWLERFAEDMALDRCWVDQGALHREEVTAVSEGKVYLWGEARYVVDWLIAHQLLRLRPSHHLEELIGAVARAMAASSVDGRTAAILEALVDHPAVDELFASDEELGAVLAQA